jgi:hypothetical protein
MQRGRRQLRKVRIADPHRDIGCLREPDHSIAEIA